MTHKLNWRTKILFAQNFFVRISQNTMSDPPHEDIEVSFEEIIDDPEAAESEFIPISFGDPGPDDPEARLEWFQQYISELRGWE